MTQWNMDQTRLPPIAHQFPISHPNGSAAPYPPAMPLPPLVPERLHPIMPRPNGAADRSSIASDASEVLNMLGELGDKVLEMDEKVEMMRGEEKKHYESLRRGLKRLKEDKPGTTASPDVSSLQRGMDALSITAGEPPAANENGDAPYCICNYCIQRMSLVPLRLVRLMEANIVTYVMCDSCDNFTLCVDCFMSAKYHHHPAHGFTLKNPDHLANTSRYKEVFDRLGPGRGLKHRASCDECKKVQFPETSPNKTKC
jgi:hypothetical protein